MNYQIIKQLAKEHGLSVTDLIALAPQNDPFYVGTPGETAAGQWFADLWRRFDYDTGVHLRRIHYRLVSQDPSIVRPNGKSYGNTQKDWDFLNIASKAARYLGLVDPGAFVDRRNPDPHLYVYYYPWEDPSPRYRLADDWGFHVDLPKFPEMPSLKAEGYTEGDLQPYHVEVWAEKTTMNDVLLPLCQRYGLNLVTGAGELSITAVLDFVRRARQADRPCRIFYVSDFDPAGLGMPISVARKIEYFLHNLGLDFDVRLDPIALTLEQVRQYRLPRTPIKPSELRRAAFENAFGEGAVELDALEALHPGELARIVEEAILDYHDDEIGSQARQQKRKLQAALDDAAEEALYGLIPEIDEFRGEFDQAVAAFSDTIAALREQMDEVYTQIIERLEGVDLDTGDFPLPEPCQADEGNGFLYDSHRDYLTQLTYYQARRNNLEVEDASL